jgi:hypothetical protein
MKKGNYKSIMYDNGKVIKLEDYIKTENIIGQVKEIKRPDEDNPDKGDYTIIFCRLVWLKDMENQGLRNLNHQLRNQLYPVVLWYFGSGVIPNDITVITEAEALARVI